MLDCLFGLKDKEKKEINIEIPLTSARYKYLESKIRMKPNEDSFDSGIEVERLDL